MYMSEDDHDMAMEQITERITAEVMEELGKSFADTAKDAWEATKRGASAAKVAVSNHTSNYKTRVVNLEKLIHEHYPKLQGDIDTIMMYGDIVKLKVNIEAMPDKTVLKTAMNLVLEVLPVDATDTRFAPILLEGEPIPKARAGRQLGDET
ncbi:hypothetical protein T484DRAFT_1757055 [Baffinella frigidus]|nr:hypothetical protein T484DRAFT_1757055 [Cryptophyta sp. CCMP2293]